ncbi:MAG: hypothetical protein ABEJ70_06850 [Halobacteriaceae archaeon]
MDRETRRRAALGVLVVTGAVGVLYGVYVQWLVLSLVGGTLAVGVGLYAWRGPRYLVWTFYLTGGLALVAAPTARDAMLALALAILGAVSLFRGRQYHRALRRRRSETQRS